MRKLLFGILAVTTMYGCDCCGGSGYSISGKLAPELLGDSIHLINMDRTTIASAPVDALGEFTIEGDVEIPTTALLAGEKHRPFAMLYLESGDINVSTDDKGEYIITGTTSNDVNTEVNAKLNVVSDVFKTLGEETPEATVDSLRAVYAGIVRNAVTENMDNIFGVNIFASQEFPNMEITEAKAFIDKFSEELQQTQQLVDLRERIIALEKTDLGQPYTDIKLLDAEGKEIALSSVVGEGKWVLLDFWATWCPPCVKEIPYLLKDYKEFKDRGFDIYGVSLDRDADAWKSYIVEHKMVWSNVLNTADSSATADYAVVSIPTNYLISPEGIIVAKNLRGEGVKEKLMELMK